MLAQPTAPSAIAHREAKTRVGVLDLAAEDRSSGRTPEDAESQWGNYDAQTRSASDSPEYAKNGCPGDVHTIDYDATGSVSGFDSNSATAVTYDERHLARTMGVDRKLTYDLNGRVLADAVGDVRTEYIWDGADLLAMVSTAPPGGPIAHVVATDHLGSPWRAWTGSGTTTSWSVSYEPFGKVTPEDGATSYSPTPAIAVRRPGQIADSASGQYQNRWRGYDASNGRYVRPDPMQQSPEFVVHESAAGLGTASYGYAANRPILYVDEQGLEPTEPSPTEDPASERPTASDVCPDPNPNAKRCYERYLYDIETCKRAWKNSPRGRAVCYSVASQAYAACLRDK